MKFILSPAKKMGIKPLLEVGQKTTPYFIEQAKELNADLKQKSPQQLMKLMKISSKLAEQNWERNQEWQSKPGKDKGLQAFQIFRGEVYMGLDAGTLNQSSLDYLDANMKILSGLYGVLSAYDYIMPYRLEMGTQLKYGKSKNLYEFWGDKITDYLNSTLEEDEWVVDLASNEYMKVIDSKKLKAKVLNMSFKDEKDGKLRNIMFYFKHARGAMMRACAEYNVQTVDELKSISVDNYIFNESLSTDKHLVYVKPS